MAEFDIEYRRRGSHEGLAINDEARWRHVRAPADLGTLPAQNGRYRMFFRDASGSSATRTPASSASLMSLETFALFFSSIQKRSRRDAFVRNGFCTCFRQACK